MPTSGILNKCATYQQTFSHRKQRSYSKIRSLTAVALLPRACIPPKQECLLSVPEAEVLCSHIDGKQCLEFIRTSTSASGEWRVHSSQVCHSLKTISYSGLLSKSTNPPDLKDGPCHVQFFRKQDFLDGASESKTSEGSLPDTPKTIPVHSNVIWPGQCSCCSGMAGERAPACLSGLQWLLFGGHPLVLAGVGFHEPLI